MTWGGSTNWEDEGDRQRAGRPRNRRVVTIITCPTCDGINVERHSVVGMVSHWFCKEGKGCDRWKESAATGGKGKGHLS